MTSIPSGVSNTRYALWSWSALASTGGIGAEIDGGGLGSAGASMAGVGVGPPAGVTRGGGSGHGFFVKLGRPGCENNDGADGAIGCGAKKALVSPRNAPLG